MKKEVKSCYGSCRRSWAYCPHSWSPSQRSQDPNPPALPVQRKDLNIFLHLTSSWPESEVFLHRCAGQDRTWRLLREPFKAECKGRLHWQPGPGDMSGRWTWVGRLASTSKVCNTHPTAQKQTEEIKQMDH